MNLELSALQEVLNERMDQVRPMKVALGSSRSTPGEIDQNVHMLYTELYEMQKQLNGDPLRTEVGEKSAPTIGQRVSVAAIGTRNSTYGPTPTHKESMRIAKKKLEALKVDLKRIESEDIPALEKALKEVKAPHVKGSSWE